MENNLISVEITLEFSEYFEDLSQWDFLEEGINILKINKEIGFEDNWYTWINADIKEFQYKKFLTLTTITIVNNKLYFPINSFNVINDDFKNLFFPSSGIKNSVTLTMTLEKIEKSHAPLSSQIVSALMIEFDGSNVNTILTKILTNHNVVLKSKNLVLKLLNLIINFFLNNSLIVSKISCDIRANYKKSINVIAFISKFNKIKLNGSLAKNIEAKFVLTTGGTNYDSYSRIFYSSWNKFNNVKNFNISDVQGSNFAKGKNINNIDHLVLCGHGINSVGFELDQNGNNYIPSDIKIPARQKLLIFDFSCTNQVFSNSNTKNYSVLDYKNNNTFFNSSKLICFGFYFAFTKGNSVKDSIEIGRMAVSMCSSDYRKFSFS